MNQRKKKTIFRHGLIFEYYSFVQKYLRTINNNGTDKLYTNDNASDIKNKLTRHFLFFFSMFYFFFIGLLDLFFVRECLCSTLLFFCIQHPRNKNRVLTLYK